MEDKGNSSSQSTVVIKAKNIIKACNCNKYQIIYIYQSIRVSVYYSPDAKVMQNFRN